MAPDNTPASGAPDLSLYHSTTCWFCARVRQKMTELGVDIELRDIGANNRFREELVSGGGKGQVPCLRIEGAGGKTDWLYESADICSYLERRYS